MFLHVFNHVQHKSFIYSTCLISSYWNSKIALFFWTIFSFWDWCRWVLHQLSVSLLFDSFVSFRVFYVVIDSDIQLHHAFSCIMSFDSVTLLSTNIRLFSLHWKFYIKLVILFIILISEIKIYFCLECFEIKIWLYLLLNWRGVTYI